MLLCNLLMKMEVLIIDGCVFEGMLCKKTQKEDLRPKFDCDRSVHQKNPRVLNETDRSPPNDKIHQPYKINNKKIYKKKLQLESVVPQIVDYTCVFNFLDYMEWDTVPYQQPR